jgi:hypothetical protein
MAGPKTVPTDASVDEFIAAVPDERRRADCQAMAALLQGVTGEKPVLWGSSIVGFGAYPMTYADGRSADWPLIAFSPRKSDLTLYIMPGFDGFEADLAALGRHRRSKTCLYLKRLADVDGEVLERVCLASVETMRLRHPRRACR